MLKYPPLLYNIQQSNIYILLLFDIFYVIIVELKNVVKRFGRVRALNGVDLEVGKGITGLIGPNGAGKTTTIGIILGLIRRDSGYVSVYGLDPWSEGERVRARIGFLDENPVFPSSMTGRRFLEYAARIYGVGMSSVDRVLDMVGLRGSADRPVSTYSAGMVQRLGLAHALLGEKEFIILDEPTANLDPIARIRVLELVRRLRKEEDLSFLVSTHVLLELERVCEEVAVMYRGRVIGQVHVDDIYRNLEFGYYILEFAGPLEAREVYRVIEDSDATIDGRIIQIRYGDWLRIRDDVLHYILENGISLVSLRPKYTAIEEYYRRLVGEMIEV